MGNYTEVMNDICERHDSWERRQWLKLPYISRVLIAPILILPYVLFELVTFLIFAVPYCGISVLLKTTK